MKLSMGKKYRIHHFDALGDKAMSELQCIARLKIHPGKLDEFKRVAAKCMELVRTAA